MSKRLFAIIFILLSGLLITAMVEYFDRYQHDKSTLDRLSDQLEEPANQLESTLNSIIEANRFFSRLMNDNPHIDRRMLSGFAEEWINKNPLIISVLSSQEYSVDFVYPLRGNERLVNLDYRLRPEQLGAIQQAVALNGTVVDAPIELIQTGRDGVIIRTAYRLNANRPSSVAAWGVASMAIDLNSLLIETGLLNPAFDFDITLSKIEEGKLAADIVGNSRLLGRLHVSKTIELPNTQWRLIASATSHTSYSVFRSGLIRSTGIILTLISVFALIRYSGAFKPFISASSDNKVAFKEMMRISLIVPFTIIIILSNIFSYKASMQSAEDLKQAQLFEIAAQLNEKVQDFFTIPSSILIYNAEQFRLGLLNSENFNQVIQSFHLQLRQQPLLTFISIGTLDGEYYAASQPPMGDDRSVRIIEATNANDRLIRIYQADDLGRKTELLSLGNSHFDARTRPWFRSAIVSGVVQWYPVYRYVIRDVDGVYDTLGMGMASVIRNSAQQPVGVIASDVALSQVNEFLAKYMARLNGIAFLAEKPSNELMASSSSEPTFFFSGDQTLRVTISESGNPVIRAVGRAIENSNLNEGIQFVEVDYDRYLVDWQTIQLPNGPALTLGIALPDSYLVSPARNVLLTNVVLTLFLWGVMLIATLLLTRWFINPLHSLSDWFKRISAGDWDATPAISSRFAELEDIRQSSDLMANSLKRKLDLVEIHLLEKDKLLDEANNQLKVLSIEDPVTGAANRQHFERIYSQEWSRVGRSQQPMAMMIIELDEYRQYIDSFGQQDADQVLKQVVKVLNDTIRRAIDLVAHISPGRFVIITPNTEAENAMILAENILRGIEYQGIVHPESKSGVFTACIGVGIYAGESAIAPEEFMASVESALHQAQSEGKNRVVLANDEVAH